MKKQILIGMSVLSLCFSAFAGDAAVFVDGDFHPNGESINDGSADAVQTAGDFIAAAFAKLTTRVENGEYGLDAGDAGLADDINWNTTTIVLDGDGVAFVDGDLDVFAITR